MMLLCVEGFVLLSSTDEEFNIAADREPVACVPEFSVVPPDVIASDVLKTEVRRVHDGRCLDVAIRRQS